MVPQGWVTLAETTFGTNLEAFCVPDSIFVKFHSQNGPPKDPRGPPELPKIVKNREKKRQKLEAKKTTQTTNLAEKRLDW